MFFNQTEFPEPSAELIFANGKVDRQSEKRTPDSLKKAMANPSARAIIFAKGRVMVKFGSGEPDSLFPLDAIEKFNPRQGAEVLLGYEEDVPIIAVPAKFDPETDAEKLPDSIKAIDYRSLAIQGLLQPARMGEVAQGASLLAWHASHRFCSRCGHESTPADGGYKRICPNCETQHFPRTDPVVIMLAVDGDQCLLGRSHHWNEGMYSALAGFIEPGETFEAAVRREINEEAGIQIGKVQYRANQPWPFPFSLMIGCFAEAKSSKIVMDEKELSDCRWFTRKEVLVALDRPEEVDFYVPPRMAIAHHLINHWARYINN